MHPSLKNDQNLRNIVITASMVMLIINLDFLAILAALLAAALHFSVIAAELQWVVGGYMLVLSRIVQGAGAAVLISVSIAIVTLLRKTKAGAADRQAK